MYNSTIKFLEDLIMELSQNNLSVIRFSDLTFDNRLIEALPHDAIAENYPRQVEHAAYSFVLPTHVCAPRLIALSKDVAQLIGFSNQDVLSEHFPDIMTGNKLIEGMQPYALCYGGHQFGHWAGQLGDGRAINLGEVKTLKYGHFTLQLKGAGPTPYSRSADGLAVLRSSIREFLCSEAMFHLGIPTTRALSLCLTGEHVLRDMFYDGNAKNELGAVVCRASHSFIRFGSFQLPAARGDVELLTLLVNQCIKSDFPHLLAKQSSELSKETVEFTPSIYLKWFSEVCDSTCSMIIHWMRVGFVHGVMNTDNMSILGETIDYGPYGWVDNFDLSWTPNTTDAQGKRYCFGDQGEIGQWNLFQLANALYPLIENAEALQQLLNDYALNYRQQWQQMMASKLGLKEVFEEDLSLFVELEQLLALVETDMTLFYRQMAKITVDKIALKEDELYALFNDCYYQMETLDDDYYKMFNYWMNTYIDRLKKEELTDELRLVRMNKVNPKFVLRNYITQVAIEAAEKGDYSEIEKLQKVLMMPYDEQVEFESYASKRPEWAREKAGCSMLSCSS